MQTKAYKVYRNSIEVMDVEYPANADNCKWFGIQMWNKEDGFIKSATIVTGSNTWWFIGEA